MHRFDKEIAPVLYGPSLIKITRYNVKPYSLCFPAHWHDRIEIIRIRSGVLLEGYDGNVRKLMPGDVILIPPRVVHKGVTDKEMVEYDVFMFDVRSFYNETDICKQYLTTLYDGRAKFETVTTDLKIIKCLDELYETEETVVGAFQRVTGVYHLLSLLFECMLVNIDQAPVKDSKFQEIIEYMETNFTDEISTASLSSRYGYSEEHFCRKFKEHIGLTPMKFVRILRLQKAFEMLREGESSMETLAEKCGFHDANYFTRCFKDHFGAPPSRFRT